MNTNSNPYYQTLIESISCIITHVDAEFRVIKQFNAGDSLIASQQGSQFLSTHDPVTYLTNLDERRTVQFDTQHARDTGETVWYQHTVNRMNDGNGIVILSTDITEQKEREAEIHKIQRRYDAILNNTSDAIAINRWGEKYNDSYVLLINTRMEQMLGYSLDEIRSIPNIQFIHPDDREYAVNRRDERHRKERLYDGTHLRGIAKSGQTLFLEGLNIMIDDENGNIIEAIVMLRDVTERVERERELVEAKIAAERALRAREIFVANMSHELRNPLHLIRGHTDLLLDNHHLSREQIDSLQAITYSVDHLTQLVGDVIDLTRFETEENSINLRSFHLHQLLNRLLGVIVIRARQKNLSFTMNIADNVPEHVRLDDVKLKQILINLIDNAIKYTIEGAIQLNVDLDEKDQLRFAVIDTGIGISSDAIDQLFEPFVRGNHDGNIPGVGLGLLISKRLVEALKGSITITSQPGIGTNVTVQIPFEALADQIFIEPALHFSQLEIANASVSILIIADQPEQSMLLEKHLSRLGFYVQITDKLAHAQTSFATIKPDVTLIDLSLDVKEIIDLVKQLRHIEYNRHLAHTPIAIISSDWRNTSYHRLRVAGCDAVITKPYRLTELNEAIAKLLKLSPQGSESKPQATGKKQLTLESVDLAVLPQLWLKEMYHYCMLGDHRAGLEHLERITETYPDIAHYLQHLLSQMWTMPIAELIKPIISEND